MYTPLGDPRELCWENRFSFMSSFSGPFLGPQKVPGPTCRPMGSRFGPGPKNEKDARRKMVQNPAGINSNGARRYK